MLQRRLYSKLKTVIVNLIYPGFNFFLPQVLTLQLRSRRNARKTVTMIRVIWRPTKVLFMKVQTQLFWLTSRRPSASKDACKHHLTKIRLSFFSESGIEKCIAASYIKLRFNSVCWLFNDVSVSYRFTSLMQTLLHRLDMEMKSKTGTCLRTDLWAGRHHEKFLVARTSEAVAHRRTKSERTNQLRLSQSKSKSYH